MTADPARCSACSLPRVLVQTRLLALALCRTCDSATAKDGTTDGALLHVRASA